MSLPGKRFYPSNDVFCQLNVGITVFVCVCVKNNNAEMETKKVMVIVMQHGYGKKLEIEGNEGTRRGECIQETIAQMLNFFSVIIYNFLQILI